MARETNINLETIWRLGVPLVLGPLALAYAYQLGPGPRGSMRLIGLLVSILGFAGVVASRYTLGRSFSIAPRATALVTTGIYSRIRNPIYVSGMFVIAGLFLMMRRPEFLVLFFVLIPVQIIRARREAAVLEAKFGDEYRNYRQRTWF